MRSRIQRRVARGAVAARPASSFALLVLSLILALATTGLLGLSASFTQAVSDGAVTSFGGYGYQVSGGGDHSIAQLRDLAEKGKAVAVVIGHGAVRSVDSRHATAGLIEELSGPSRYGRLVSGSYPRLAGEVSVSIAAANQAGIGVGDQVTLDSEDASLGVDPYLVTGLTVNPADTSEVMVAAVTRSPTIVERSQTWLTDMDPNTITALQTDLSSGSTQVGSIQRTTKAAVSEVSSRELSALPYFIALVFAVGVVGIAATLLGLRATSRSTTEALMAADLSRQKAWWTVQSGLYAIPLLGGLLGAAAGYVLLMSAGPIFSARLNQMWVNTPIEAVFETSGLILSYTLLALLSSYIITQRRPRPRNVQPMSRKTWPLLVAGGLGIVISGACVFLYLTQRLHPGAILGIIIAAIAWPLLLWHLPWLRGTPIQDRAVHATTRNIVPVLNIVMLVLSTAAYYSSTLVMQIDNENIPKQSYIMVDSITANDVASLTADYPDIMSQATVLTLPDESHEHPRAVNADALSCLKGFIGKSSLDFKCDKVQTFQSSIAVAPTSGPGSALAGLAGPQAQGSRDIGIAFFEPGNGVVSRVGRATIQGTSSLLGIDGMPGFVLDPSSPETQRLGIKLSNFRFIYVNDFQSYSDSKKNAFRTAVLTRAGYSSVRESDSTESRQLNVIAATLPCFAAIIVAIALALLSVSANAEQSSLRDALEISGATHRQRLRLLTPILASALIATCVALVIGWYCEHPDIYLWGTYLSDYYHYGWYWAIPIPVVLFVEIGILAAAAGKSQQKDTTTDRN